KYRGGAPIHYAIINGDKEAGVTIMEMVKEMDAGDMISSASLPILDTDNVGTMFDKLAILGRDLLLKTLPDYLSGDLKPVPQDHSQATFSPNLSAEEERLDWSKPAREVFNHIRGMNPWPVAHTLLDGQRFKIYEAELAEGSGSAGQIIAKTKKALVVAAGEGALSLTLVQPAGKPKMPIVDFLNGIGRSLEVGDVLGE
ncbi:methionyl-tRNA formyltransferase, partial [Streptococcus equi subsp. equi]